MLIKAVYKNDNNYYGYIDDKILNMKLMTDTRAVRDDLGWFPIVLEYPLAKVEIVDEFLFTKQD